jgi:GTP pyrophosphokinase
LGEKPDPLLLSLERFTAHESVSQGAVMVDGSENASVQYAPCCHPLPGDAILGYLGRGEGLVIHTHDCSVGQKLKHKDSERFIAVEWSDEPMRSFEAPISVTAVNGKGLLAQVAQAIAQAEGDITQAHTGSGIGTAETIDLRFVVAVRDLQHLESVLRSLRRCPPVSQAKRMAHL